MSFTNGTAAVIVGDDDAILFSDPIAMDLYGGPDGRAVLSGLGLFPDQGTQLGLFGIDDAIVVAGISALAHAWNGGTDATGLPRRPVTDRQYAAGLASKWEELYLGHSGDTQGVEHWTNEILSDGPARAWANFSTSPEPVQKQVVQRALALSSEYGGPFELGPGMGQPGQPGQPGGQPLPHYFPSTTAGLSLSNPLLIGGAVVLVALLLGGRRRTR